MQRLTATWICDNCGDPITDVDAGWVEWLIRPDGDRFIGRGLRLVHQYAAARRLGRRCQHQEQLEFKQDGSILSDLPLRMLLGPDGLLMLLGFIAKNELPTLEVLELIKRLHVPGYEHARLHFEDAIAEGVFEPTTVEGFYPTSDIQRVLDYVASKDA